MIRARVSPAALGLLCSLAAALLFLAVAAPWYLPALAAIPLIVCSLALLAPRLLLWIAAKQIDRMVRRMEHEPVNQSHR